MREYKRETGRRQGALKIISRGIDVQEIFLEGDLRRRGLIRNKGQLEVVGDPVHHGEIRKESDNFRPAAALGAEHGYADEN